MWRYDEPPTQEAWHILSGGREKPEATRCPGSVPQVR